MTNALVNTATTEKIRAVWNVVEVIVEEAVVAAESLSHLNTPDAQKAFVRDTVMGFLKHIEAQKDFLPSYAEDLAFKGVEFVLDLLIDRIAASRPAAAAPVKAA
jgi:hypothetical protein